MEWLDGSAVVLNPSTPLPPNASPLAEGALRGLPAAEVGTAAGESPYGLRDRASDYRTLVKPRITRMVVITAALGFFLAVREGYGWTWLQLAGSLAGTALSCMAASVFNQVIERRTDALMPRTARRPLAAGRLSNTEAMGWGLGLMLAGQAALCSLGTPLASGLAAFTIFSYALVYTPMKRVSPTALYVGAVPGAMPPLIGYAAVTGSVFTAEAATAWAVCLIMLLWQIPHFLAIGYLYRADYAAAGLAMHAVRDPSGGSSFRHAIAVCGLLLVAGMLPTLLGGAGWVAFGVTLICGLGYLGLAVRWAVVREAGAARRLFFASLIYLPVVLTAVMVDAR